MSAFPCWHVHGAVVAHLDIVSRRLLHILWACSQPCHLLPSLPQLLCQPITLCCSTLAGLILHAQLLLGSRQGFILHAQLLLQRGAKKDIDPILPPDVLTEAHLERLHFSLGSSIAGSRLLRGQQTCVEIGGGRSAPHLACRPLWHRGSGSENSFLLSRHDLQHGSRGRRLAHGSSQGWQHSTAGDATHVHEQILYSGITCHVSSRAAELQ